MLVGSALAAKVFLRSPEALILEVASASLKFDGAIRTWVRRSKIIKNREAAHRANACEQSLHVGRERATKTGVSNQEENILKQALVLGSPVRVLSARVHGRASQCQQSAYYKRSRRHGGASSGSTAAHACVQPRAQSVLYGNHNTSAVTSRRRFCTVPAVDHFLMLRPNHHPIYRKIEVRKIPSQ